MGSTYYYREPDRERDWDARSTRSFREEVPRNATVRRYKISDDDSRSSDHLDTKIKVTDRSRSGVRRSYYEADFEEDDSRSYYHGSRAPEPERERPRDDYREVRITREMSPPEREREVRSPQYDVDRYTRTTEYWREPERSPQQIIIRNEQAPAPQPIIIRERAPERQQIVIRERDRSPDPPTPREESVVETKSEHKSEHKSESRAVTRREPSPEPEEDYYYERRVRRIRRAQSDDHQEERQREASDDEEYYYRRTEEGYESNDEHGPSHHRHLAEGAIAGLGAAALLGHHRKKSGAEQGGRGRKAGELAGGAALGALAAEGLTKVQAYRSRSRARSEAADRDRGGRRRERNDDEGERSRSRSGSGDDHKNLKKIGTIAALGALAGYAVSRRGKSAAHDDRRSRSRRRRSSRARDRSLGSEGRARSAGSSGSEREVKSRNDKAKIAGAGLASAVAAGLVDRARSKSRGGGRSRSKGRVAIPVAAAGLGGAALAGLYQANKAGKAERARERSLSGSRSRSRSRRRSRRRSGVRSAPPATDDQGLIEFGSGPVFDERSRSRANSQGSPARLRSRSRGTEGEEPGSGAYAAHQRRERKRAERAQRQQEEAPPNQQYGFGPYAQAAPEPPMAQPQFVQNQTYYPPPQEHAFAQEPPHNPYSPAPNFVNNQQPYNPNDFPHNPPYAPPGPPNQGYYQHGAGGQYEDPNYQHNVSPFAYNPERYLPVSNAGTGTGTPEGTSGRRKSVQFDLNPEDPGAASSMALVRRNTTGSRREVDATARESRVARRSTDVDPFVPPAAPEAADFSPHRRRLRRRSRQYNADDDDNARRHQSTLRLSDMEPADYWTKSGRRRRLARASDGSGDTIDLPDRFDSHGRQKSERDEDSFANRIGGILQGSGRVGRWLHRLTDSSASR